MPAADSAVVTGRAFRSDPRYKAVLLEPKIVGRTAEIRPSIAINDTGFAAVGWDAARAAGALAAAVAAGAEACTGWGAQS